MDIDQILRKVFVGFCPRTPDDIDHLDQMGITAVINVQTAGDLDHWSIDWDRMLALNLRSAFLLSRAVLPAMLETGWGRIVFVSSKTAVTPRAKQAAYAVSKMGLITLTKTISAEIKGSGVTANTILPSIIDTPTNRKFMPKADPAKWVPPQRIAATMRFLCSNEGASTNGAEIAMYGDV